MSHLRKTWKTAALTEGEKRCEMSIVNMNSIHLGHEDEEKKRTQRHQQSHGSGQEILDATTANLEEREEEEWDKEGNQSSGPNDHYAQLVNFQYRRFDEEIMLHTR